jgi:hypothetical protein
LAGIQLEVSSFVQRVEVDRLAARERGVVGDRGDASRARGKRVVLWQDPATAMRERKRLIRLLAIDVT